MTQALLSPATLLPTSGSLLPFKTRSSTAGPAALCCAIAAAFLPAFTPAVAQTQLPPRETAQAVVNIDQPGQAPFSAAIVNRLRAPAGFTVELFASGLGKPRMLEVAADGSVLVTRRDPGDVLVLRDTDGDGRADTRGTYLRNLPGLNGIALRAGDVTVITNKQVLRAPWPGPGAPTVLVDNMPDAGQHPNRMVRFAPDGDMFVTIGSSCNDCAEENQLERATMMRYSPDGARRTVVANGLRNTIGYDWHPVSGALWGMDHGSDFHGDDTPPEELNRIVAGGHYGWPVCYAKRTVDPLTHASPSQLTQEPGQERPKGTMMTREQFCAPTIPSVLEITAHSAPLAMRFYTGAASGQGGFPAAYRNDAFVALRGSWNRDDPSGYKVVRIRYSPAGEPIVVEDFLTGFLSDDKTLLFGRPVGVAIDRDGSLLVSDDTLGAIYRVKWTGVGAARQ